MYLFEIAACAADVIYVVVKMQKWWCKFRPCKNNHVQDHAEEETGYRQPSEQVLGNICKPKSNLEHGNHSSMQVPVEETNAGSTAELAMWDKLYDNNKMAEIETWLY